MNVIGSKEKKPTSSLRDFDILYVLEKIRKLYNRFFCICMNLSAAINTHTESFYIVMLKSTIDIQLNARPA